MKPRRLGGKEKERKKERGQMAVRILFEQELQELEQELSEMGKQAVETVKQALDAFTRHDQLLAAEIIQNDHIINEMERAVESRCLNLMLREQPVARDLRHISMALKVVTDLERIGDHAADIAELVLHLQDVASEQTIHVLPMMEKQVTQMLNAAVEAFVSRDRKRAQEIETQDDAIDETFNKVKEEAVRLLKAEQESPDKVIDLLMIAKYLERIGDHAVNVCEWTEFYDTGKVGHCRIL